MAERGAQVLVDVRVDGQHGGAAGGQVAAEQRGRGGLAAAALADERDAHASSSRTGANDNGYRLEERRRSNGGAIPAARPQVHALTLPAEQDEHLHLPVTGAALPMRDPGVELGGLAGPHGEVLVTEHQPQPAGQHVDPLEALVADRLGLGSGCPDRPSCTRWAGPGLRVSGQATASPTRRGSARTRGSSVGRLPISSSRPTPCARAMGSSSSSVARRLPDSSRDSVLVEIPVLAASAASVVPRSRRRASSRSPTAASTRSTSSMCSPCRTGDPAVVKPAGPGREWSS